MAIQTIRLGNYPNDGTGDDLRTAFTKVNANFTELSGNANIVNAANVGSGVGVFAQRNLTNLEFKTLTSNDNSIAITPNVATINLRGITKVENDLAPKLGADLLLNGRMINGQNGTGDILSPVWGLDVRYLNSVSQLLIDSNNVNINFGSFPVPNSNPIDMGGFVNTSVTNPTLVGNVIDFGLFGNTNVTSNTTGFSGSYNDLTNKPTLFSGYYNDLLAKPTLASVAASGSYNDLTNQPTIPTSFSTLVNGAYTASFGSDGVLTLPAGVGDIKRDGVSVFAPLVNNSDNVWNVDPSRTDTYTPDGSLLRPFKTITAALAAIEVRIAAGTLTQFDPTANIVLSPQFIVLSSSTTEDVALTRGHIYIVGNTPAAGHVPIWIQGHITITPGATGVNAKATNDFGIFHIAVIPTGNFHGIRITGANACRVYLEDVYVYQGNNSYSCVQMDNSDATTKLEIVDGHMSRSGGSTYLIDIQSAYCKIDNLETNGQGQVLNYANAATGTMLNSVIDADVGSVITLSGTVAFGMGNCILNNTSTAANSYGVNMSGTSTMQFGVCTFNVPAAQATNRAINGAGGNVVLYTSPIFQYGSTNRISTAITLIPLVTTFTAV